MPPRRRLAIPLAAALAVFATAAPAAERRLAVAWNEAGAGRVRALAAAPPFGFVTPALAVDADTTLRFSGGKLYAVSRAAGNVRVIGANWTVERTYAVGGEPLDIAVVSPARAYLTRAGDDALLRLDLVTGATQSVVSLASFADPDGDPDLGMLGLEAGRLFVQIRRYNQDGPLGQSPPAYLAVVDIATEQLVDANPALPGAQAIELAGTAPKHKMQIVAAARRLYLSATGAFFDAGGIEGVDLDALVSLGLAVAEADGETGADLGPFVLLSPTHGFLTYSTDLLLSSHLTGFTVGVGADPGQLHVVVDYAVPALAHDSTSNVIFLPDGTFGASGVRAFDAASGVALTASPIPTGGPPTDLAELCDCGDPACSLEAYCAPVPAPSGNVGALLLGAALCAAGLARVRAHAESRGASCS